MIFYSHLSVLIPLCFLSLHFILLVAVNFPTPYSPIDNLAINCGSTGNSTSPDGRQWIGDIGSKFSPSQQRNCKSITSKADHLHSDLVHRVPYMTAQISRSQFTYTFKVNPGQKFIRLHFYPTSYPSFERYKAFFTVKAGPYTLLSNFSASLTADALGLKYIVKEFCLNVNENQALNITFSPSSTFVAAYAFVNGIDIVSMPNGLYHSLGSDPSAHVVGQNYKFYIENNYALEVVQRLTIGGSSIPPVEDSGMFREWSEDSNYLIESGVSQITTTIPIKYINIPAHTAPQKVYQTTWTPVANKEYSSERNNYRWKLPVDLGFRYMVRLHFCELDYGIKEIGQREFCIIINQQIAEAHADIIEWSGGNGIAVYRDYVLMMEGDRMEGKRDLLIDLRPSCHNSRSPKISSDPVLNGLEVFKLSNPDNNLAGSNSVFLPVVQSYKASKLQKSALAFQGVNKVANCFIIGITLLSIAVHQLCTWAENSSKKDVSKSSPKEICRRFSITEMQSATNNFDDAFTIGCGGFGKVYKGLIDGGDTVVAIKRLHSKSKQGAHEFWTEIEMLSKLRYAHLVTLIGYCDECQEMILVYEYMAHGTLADHIFNIRRNGNRISSLTWKQRLNICIGAARGLNYLHTATLQNVIHRDVKSTNILLDENWVAKISDFGLSKMGIESQSRSYISTNVKGTFGYLDPEYFSTRRLTRKSDVYAFGVVLLEVLCGRPAVDMRLEEEQHGLALWAQRCIREGMVDQIIDPSLRTQISVFCLKVFIEVANKCLHNYSKDRPTMDEVVRCLEISLESLESLGSCTEEEAISVSREVEQQNHGAIQESTGADSQLMEPLSLESLESIGSCPEEEAIDFRRKNEQQSDGAVQGSTSADSQLMERPTFGQRHTHQSRRKTKFTVPKLVQSMALITKGKDLQRIEKGYSSDSRSSQWWRRWNPLSRHSAKKSMIKKDELHFSLAEILAATENFSSHLIIRKFGNMVEYKGCLHDRDLLISITRLKLDSTQNTELWNKKEIFAELHHVHVHSPIGYCSVDNTEKVLVYNYMSNGSLDDHLFGTNNDPLPWKKRLEICVGAARGLQFLHRGESQTIIHCDIKPANILLDHDWVPKVSDFELSKVLVHSDTAINNRTSRIIGTWGYMASEYVFMGFLSDKLDVYSFGMVLLEVLSGRRFSNYLSPFDERYNLLEWFKYCIRNKCIHQVIDPYLMGKITPECLREIVKITYNSLLYNSIERPSMYDVVESLQRALQLQEKQFSGATEDVAVERSSRYAVIQAYNEALFNDNDFIIIEDTHESESDNHGMSFSPESESHTIEWSQPMVDVSDLDPSNLAR